MSRKNGFTLVELLVAIALAAVLAASLAGVMRGTIRLYRGLKDRARLDQRARVVVDRLGQELRNSVPLPGTSFSGAEEELSFFTVLPPLQGEDGSAPRLARVTWRGEADGEGQYVLVREESVLSPDSAAPDRSLRSVFLGDIRFEYAGAGGTENDAAWQGTWENAGQRPRGVRAVLSLRQGSSASDYEAAFLVPTGESSWANQ